MFQSWLRSFLGALSGLRHSVSTDVSTCIVPTGQGRIYQPFAATPISLSSRQFHSCSLLGSPRLFARASLQAPTSYFGSLIRVFPYKRAVFEYERTLNDHNRVQKACALFARWIQRCRCFHYVTTRICTHSNATLTGRYFCFVNWNSRISKNFCPMVRSRGF